MPRIPGVRRLFRLATPSAARIAADVDDELTFHLEERTRALMAEGLGEGEAAARARREFGDVPRARAALVAAARGPARHARTRLWLGELARDVRLAARALRRAPTFTAVAVLTLALGVGANATMLGLVERLLLRAPAGVADADRVVRVYGRNWWTANTRSYPDYLDLRDHARALAGVAAYQVAEVAVRRPSRTEVRVNRATAGYFPTLGVRPALGRAFTADEASGDGARVVVLSDRLWRELFDADPAVLGRELATRRSAYRVIGVAPPAFRGVDAEPADAWVPLGDQPRDRGNFGAVHVVARLRDGVSIAAADREANAVNRAGYVADGLRPDADAMQLGALSVTQGPSAPREVRVAVWLAAVASIVLLIAAANVAHLLLARACARERETAVRFALGASRGQIARRWLAEGALLASLGAGAAIGVVAVVGPALARFALPGLDAGLSLDARGVGMVAALAAFTALACGLVPALHAGRARVGGALRSAGNAVGPRRGRTRSVLLLTQVTLSGVLLVGAGLFARSFQRVRAVDLGFDADRLLVVRAAGLDANLTEGAADTVLRRLAERARIVPGAEAVALAHSVPFLSGWRTRFFVAGRDPQRGADEGGGRFNRLSAFVAPEYARAAGLRLLAGRWIAPTDRAASPPVAVVNEALARELRPDAPAAAAIGQCIAVLQPEAPCTRIVGVVRAARVESVFDDAPSQYYLPLEQARRGEGASAILVRTAGDPARLAEVVRRALASAAPATVEVVVRPLADAIEPVRRPWMLGATVFACFGALALLVSAAGLYGVVTLVVVERMREWGVRRALGADTHALARSVGARVGRLVAVGLALGLALGAAGSRAGAGLLYGIGPLDPAAYAGAALLLGIAALVAALVPVRRATRVDPVAALRHE